MECIWLVFGGLFVTYSSFGSVCVSSALIYLLHLFVKSLQTTKIILATKKCQFCGTDPVPVVNGWYLPNNVSEWLVAEERMSGILYPTSCTTPSSTIYLLLRTRAQECPRVPRRFQVSSSRYCEEKKTFILQVWAKWNAEKIRGEQ